MIDKYMSDLEQAKTVFEFLDVSGATRADYKARISYFLEFVGEHGFNINTYLEFKRHLRERTDIAVSTKNKYMVAARVWLKELQRRGEIDSDITAGVKVFQQTKKHRKMGITDAEMAVLSEHMRVLPPSPQNSRLRAILSLLALQGLREIEVVRLEVEDIDLVDNVAWVLGKGKDDKEPVDLNPETVSAIKEHMKENCIASGAVFTSLSNNRGRNRLTTRGLQDIVKDKLRELGIEKSAHGFRHWFTTTLIKTYKGDLLEVCRHTRHSSLEMLQVYNDAVKAQADLPRFYSAFEGVAF